MKESPKLELKANEKNLSLTMELFIKTVLNLSTPICYIKLFIADKIKSIAKINA